MYAVIESGGKQYRVELGTEIEVDRLEAQPGDTITLERVLLVADEESASVGRPFVDGAVVNADVVAQVRGDKIVVFKYRPKARRRVKKGFRASLTTLRISEIAYAGVSAAQAAEEAKNRRLQDEREAERAAAERAAADQALAARLAQAEPESVPASPAPQRSRGAGAAAATLEEADAATSPDASADTETGPVPESAAPTPAPAVSVETPEDADESIATDAGVTASVTEAADVTLDGGDESPAIETDSSTDTATTDAATTDKDG